ncbi:hypothetical protein [Streptomyces sp. NPDC002851]
MTAIRPPLKPPGVPGVLGFGLFVAFACAVPFLFGAMFGHPWLVAASTFVAAALVVAAVSLHARRPHDDTWPLHEREHGQEREQER